MRIYYSTHAEDQIKERDISKQLVNEILQKPQQVITAKKGRKIAQSIVKCDLRYGIWGVRYVDILE